MLKKLINFIIFYKNINNLKVNQLFDKMSRKTYEQKMDEYLDRVMPTIYEVIDENDEELMYESDDSDDSSDLYD